MPWLLFEGQVIEFTGYGRNTLDKLVDCGTLAPVRPNGCGQRRFRKIQVATLLGISVEQELAQFRKEPWLLSEKATMVYTGYTHKVLEHIVRAGGLEVIRPAGLRNARFRKTEVAKLLGLEKVI